jgi:FkbM family methyltransferase
MTIADRLDRSVHWHAAASFLEPTRVRTVFDCGANVGVISRIYADLFRAATIYAFEPVPETHAALARECAAVDRIVPVQAAVSDRDGEATIHLDADHWADSLIRRPEPDPARPRRGRTLMAPTLALDGFAGSRGIEFVDLLKLDVEGAELLAISGAGRLLANQRVGVICCELNFKPRHAGHARASQIIEALWAHDYRLFDFYEETRPDPSRGIGWLDGIFLPASQHPAFR